MLIKELHEIRRQYERRQGLLREIAVRYLMKVATGLAQQRGQRMAVYANDWIGIGIYVDGVYEKAELDAFMSFIEPLRDIYPAWTVADIGANIGNHSLYFSRHFDRVLAFEPNPPTFRLLQFNADYSRNISAFPFGLGKADQRVPLYEIPGNFGAASAVHFKDRGVDSVEIEVKTLDGAGVDFTDLGLIKIDVEGMECEVLEGGLQTISAKTPIILFEQAIGNFTDDVSGSDSTRLLSGLGYKFCWLQKSSRGKSTFGGRLGKLKRLLFGSQDRLSIVTGEHVPRAGYSMLIAVPPKHQERLGLS